MIGGRFRVIRLLGHGGMGRVYLAQDEALGREVAVKVLKEEINDDEARGRFRREGQAIARLRHRHIVNVFDVGEHEGHPFLVMRYVKGETLEDILRKKTPLTLVRKLELVDALCDGLAHAHEAGIVHRDIKPGNLLVEESGTLKIVDFGIACLDDAQKLTRVGAKPGTYNYMSPEQHTGCAVDHRSDIFAVGAVAYELLTGEQAFPGALPAVMFRIVQTDPPPMQSFVDDLDPELSRIVSKALAKDPDQRYQDLASLRQELASVRGQLVRNQAKRPGHPQDRDDGRAQPGVTEPVEPVVAIDAAANQAFESFGVPAYPGCKYLGELAVSGANDDHRIELSLTAVASSRSPAVLVDFYRHRLPGWTFEPKEEGGRWSTPKDAPEAELSIFGVAELRMTMERSRALMRAASLNSSSSRVCRHQSRSTEWLPNARLASRPSSTVTVIAHSSMRSVPTRSRPTIVVRAISWQEPGRPASRRNATSASVRFATASPIAHTSAANEPWSSRRRTRVPALSGSGQ